MINNPNLYLSAALAVLLLPCLPGCPSEEPEEPRVLGDVGHGQMEEDIAALQAEVAALQAWRDSAEGPLADLITDVAALSGHEERIVALEDAMAQAAADASTALATSFGTQGTLSEVEVEVAGLASDVDSFTGTLLGMQSDIQVNWITGAGAAGDAAVAQSTADTGVANAATAQASADTNAAAIVGVQATVVTAQGTADAGVQAAAAAQSDATDAQQNVDATLTLVQAAQADADANALDIASLETTPDVVPTTIQAYATCTLVGAQAYPDIDYQRVAPGTEADVYYASRRLSGGSYWQVSAAPIAVSQAETVFCGLGNYGNSGGEDFEAEELPAFFVGDDGYHYTLPIFENLPLTFTQSSFTTEVPE